MRIGNMEIEIGEVSVSTLTKDHEEAGLWLKGGLSVRWRDVAGGLQPDWDRGEVLVAGWADGTEADQDWDVADEGASILWTIITTKQRVHEGPYLRTLLPDETKQLGRDAQAALIAAYERGFGNDE